MSEIVDDIDLIVVAGTWPTRNTGHAIGRRSSLKVFSKWFRRIHYFGPDREEYDGDGEWKDEDIRWEPLPILKGPLWARFLKSIATGAPAITVQYQSAKSVFERRVSEIIENCSVNGRSVVVIYDGAPSACFLPKVRRNHPEVLQVVRSSEFFFKGFSGLEKRGSVLSRLAWRVELAKIRRFERKIYSEADFFWANTVEDSDSYRQLLGVSSDGVFGVSAEVERYSDLPKGNAHTVVHIGTADLRKGLGLSDFIKNGWPLVRAAVPKSRLVLGGRGTERFSDDGQGIFGLGFVEDDRDVLNQGQIAINPQEIGAGRQVKSVVAMLSGKVLVSTPLGVQGVGGTDKEHYFVTPTYEQMSQQIISLMGDPDQVTVVANQGQKLMAGLYNDDSLAESTRLLMEILIRAAANR